MKRFVFVLFCALGACVPEQKSTSNQRSPIEGTWQLLSAQNITGADTVFTDYTVGMKGIKMINQNYFAFFQHDLNKGTDSLAKFSAGSGSYTYENGHYIENLAYCTGRQWEGNTFEFELMITGDTLVQEGREKLDDLGIDHVIREIYVRLK
ncbi:hypothetical protein SAMN04488029_3290 [Reichenbachiella faecimaris]|uniref:Lipocalin-like domain-containing protein n=1 Tax=Reichenbachiella faecimaris TaxID=692418 RepID=A0A1W2GKL4_REIFA|nr:hypothetical protein [Reichenbachiella faecimaris]SMD37199.1 hypothetical protein SAMN04488029_3290 [Reichenbachiella faecimaris]